MCKGGQSIMTVLDGWENFYVIVGSSAGALIGLQFVVITLISARPISGADAQAGGAFATPTVVHFGVVLFLSAIASMPWSGITAVASLWGLAGLCGVAYTLVVARRMGVQRAYQPVFEDWLFHVLLPFVAYAVLAISAYLAHSHARHLCQIEAGGVAYKVEFATARSWTMGSKSRRIDKGNQLCDVFTALSERHYLGGDLH
jgi:hypothetical protein